MSDDFQSHELVTATKLNRSLRTGRCLARGRRITNSSATSTEVGVQRLDDIPIFAGRMYLIKSSSLLLNSSVANDVAVARFRITTDGSTPTTASPLLTQAGTRIDNTSTGDYVNVLGPYMPTADETLSILMSVGRGAGTGNISMLYSSVTPIDMMLFDCGEDPGDTGVDL